jgi:hypothetical protein
MPLIDVQQNTTVELQLDMEITDILNDCSSDELLEAQAFLENSGYGTSLHRKHFQDQEWIKGLRSLEEIRHRISVDDESTIEQIVKKYKI